uniref:PDZ domain containing 4 n=2 Tax=Nothobranchius TaxID=28779 RepID=A0A1A8P728_9TELE
MGCWLSGPWMEDQTTGGRSLAHLSQRDALRIIAASQRPITLQIKGQRRRGTDVIRESWEPLPLNLQHLNLPLPPMGVGMNTSSPSYPDRHFYSHLSLPQEHCEAGRYSYLSSSPQDTVDISHQELELSGHRSKRQNCLTGCCNPDLDEPTTCNSQTDDEDFILEKPMGFMPLHHELDSGLGWTDGSLHQGDLSGLETEEGGLEDCHPHGNLAAPGFGGFGGGSPSSESFISSELSDSGFYSVSTGEFRHFQRLLEKRMRLYNARMQHQGEPCERRERRDSCPKSHRELLEAIPEALTVQPQCQHLQHGMDDGAGPVMDVPPRGLFRVSSVQFHKADRPSLNRHSSSSGALFNPSHAGVSRMTAPVLSTCSTPSSHRRPQVSMQQQYHHQGSSSVGMLRRSRTLHHRPPPQEYRRRASHPASPSYCAATLHYCGGVTPQSALPPGLLDDGELEAGVAASHPAGMALSAQQHPTALGHIRCLSNNERCYDSNGQIPRNDWWHSKERVLIPEAMITERERELEQKCQFQKEKELEREAKIQEEKERERHQELERSQASEQQPLLSHVHPPQAGDVNDTWPKPASRQSHGAGGGRGLYSTLEGPPGAGITVGCDAKNRQINGNSSPNPSSGLQSKPGLGSKPIPPSRITRSQMLRDRASQLADERSGMSTDEETSADMLLGRYWSRTERKEHFLLAREQKQQQQLMARGMPVRHSTSRGGASIGDGAVLESRGVGPFAEGRCNMVLEMSQRKLSRLRHRKLLDDWTTVEELLTHGNRLDNQETMLCPSSLLTVTTV